MNDTERITPINKKPSTTTKKKSKDSTGQNSRSKKKKKIPTHSKLLGIGLIIAAIPCVIVAYIVIQALVDTGKPIFGDRYVNDLDPVISSANVETIKTSLGNIKGVEEVHINLISSTLRVMIDIEDGLDLEGAKKIGNDAVTNVKVVLPFDTYFKKIGTKKMYDFEIYILDKFATKDTDPSLNILMHKSSGMDEVVVQILSEPLNPAYIEQIEAEAKAEAEAEAKAKADTENGVEPEVDKERID